MELRQRLLLSLVAAAVLAPAGAARAELPALRALVQRGATVTAAVIDLPSGRVVESLNADDRLAPASLSKLVVTAAALDAWPVDRTFDTLLLSDAVPRDGAVDDLVLRGYGDATLDEEKLWSLAAQLRDQGVREIRGRIHVAPSSFGTLACDTRDRCQSEDRSDRAYNALLSSVGLDFGNWCVIVRGTVAGSPASVRSCSGTPLPIAVDGVVTTGNPGARDNVRIERLTRDGLDRLRVQGSVPAGTTLRTYRAMSDPALGTGLLLREMLRQMGIRADGGVVVLPASRAADTGRVTLARVESLQLREQLGRMMRYSNNFIADVLTLNLAAERTGLVQDRLSTAAIHLLPLLRDAAAPSADSPVMMSGSGLTPENRLSARDLTRLLTREFRDPRRFPAFYGTLVVPREAPFDFLRRGGDDWLDRVALKTGSMNEPVSIAGIAGYLRRSDGGFMAFAIIVNGTAGLRQVPLAQAIGAARGDLEGVLARH